MLEDFFLSMTIATIKLFAEIDNLLTLSFSFYLFPNFFYLRIPVFSQVTHAVLAVRWSTYCTCGQV